MTTPKSKKRNKPHMNVTIEGWMDQWLRGMVDSSGQQLSWIVRDIFTKAHKQGYTPGTTTLRDVRYSSTMRTGQ